MGKGVRGVKRDEGRREAEEKNGGKEDEEE